MIKSFLLITAVSLFSASNVFAWCSEPMAPSAPSTWSKPTKPMVPYCVNEWNNTHAYDYSNCEIRNLD